MSISTNFNKEEQYNTEISNLMNEYYNSYIVDKEIKGYLDFLTNISVDGGNYFDVISKKLLRLLYMSDYPNSIFKKGKYNINTYLKILISLRDVAFVLYDLINTQSKFDEFYTSLTKIKFEYNGGNRNIPLDQLYTIKNVIYEVDDINKILIIKSFIRTNIGEYTIQKITANSTINWDDANATDQQIIQNYLNFMLSFNNKNLKLQIYAIYFYMNILNSCFFFIQKIESLYILDSNNKPTAYKFKNDICAYFDTYILSIYDLRDEIQRLANKFDDKIKVTVAEKCPIEFKLFEKYNYININQMLEDDYVVFYDGIRYEIESAIYEYNKEDYKRYISSIKIKARTDNCYLLNEYPVLNVKIGQNLEIVLKLKDFDELKNDYIDISGKLNKLNDNIIDIKTSINRISEINKGQKNHIYYLNIKLLIYILLFFIIGISLIVIIFMKEGKFMNTLIIVAIIILANIYHYYFNYYYIEQFETGNRGTDRGNGRERVANYRNATTHNCINKKTYIDGYIAFYSSPNFTGDIIQQCQSINGISLKHTMEKIGFNDISKQIKSIKVPAGIKVNFMKDNVIIVTYNGDIANITTPLLNKDTVDSIIISDFIARDIGVTLYTQQNLQGNSHTFQEGIYELNSTEMQLFKENISSIKISPNYQVTFYKTKNQQEFNVSFKADVVESQLPTLNNYNLSKSMNRMKVEKINVPFTCINLLNPLYEFYQTHENLGIFVKTKMDSMKGNLIKLILAYHSFLSTFSSTNLLSQLSKTLSNEHRNYIDYKNYYNRKEEQNEKVLQIEYLEIIYKTEFIKYLCYTFVVLVVIHILYTIIQKYDDFFICLTIIVILFNIAYYFINVVRPTRTRARQKYQMAPSKFVKVKM